MLVEVLTSLLSNLLNQFLCEYMYQFHSGVLTTILKAFIEKILVIMAFLKKRKLLTGRVFTIYIVHFCYFVK